MNYTRMTDAEVNEVALGILAGTIFTDRHCYSPDEIGLTFMVFTMMEKDDLKNVRDVLTHEGEKYDADGLVYEFIAKALPMGVNGNPTFSSVKITTPEDAVRIVTRLEEIRDFVGPFGEEEE